MKIILLALVSLSLLQPLPILAADRSFGHFAGNADSLRPPVVPADAKERKSDAQNRSRYSDSAEWLAYRQQQNTTVQANSLVEVDVFRGEDHNGNYKYYGAKDLKELTILNAEFAALRRIMTEHDTFKAVQKTSGKISAITENTLPERYYQGQYSVSSLSDYIKLRKEKKIGNYHTLAWVEKVQSEHGMVYTRRVAQAGNVFIRTRTLVSKGYDGSLPATDTTMNYILAKLGGEAFAPSQEPAPVARLEAKEPEATHRPELVVAPTPDGTMGTTALIPATDQLPARVLLKGGQPNSSVVFHLRRDGGLLKAQGKQDRYELPVRVDAQGNAEVQFAYTGGPLTSSAEYELIAMNEGKKATARIVVGLGLDFERIRAIQGQSYASHIFAFSLGVKSRFHPRLDLTTYLYYAEQSKVWGDRTLGVHITPEWLNRGAGDDIAYDWTTEIKPLPGGNGLVATDSAKVAKQPYYEGMKYSYPAVKLESSGKHVYKVAGTPVVIEPDGVVVGGRNGEPAMNNQPLLVMTVDADPDNYFKMLACSLDAQDGIQWLIWEGAKSIPAAGKVFDGVQTGAGILCKLTQGDYENAFYDFSNFAGGKALDKLGLRLKEHPEKYSQNVHTAYKRAQTAYDGLMAKKNRDERDRLIQKSLEKYALAPSSRRAEDDVDPSAPAPVIRDSRTAGGKTPATSGNIGGAQSNVTGDAKNPGKEFDRSLEEAGKAAQDIGKDLRELGKGLLNILK